MYWYNVKDFSFGFIDQEKIYLNITDDEECEKRLSWRNYSNWGMLQYQKFKRLTLFNGVLKDNMDSKRMIHIYYINILIFI